MRACVRNCAGIFSVRLSEEREREGRKESEREREEI